MKWRIWCLIAGLVLISGWFVIKDDLRALMIPDKGAFQLQPFYRSHARGQVGVVLGSIGFIYAIYIIVSLVTKRMKDSEAKIHLAIWTIAPPLWFFFEYFIWFDNHDSAIAVQNLKNAQEVTARFWAAVLAVMLLYRLGEIVKDAKSPTNRKNTK